MLRHKDYIGHVEYDDEAEIFHGEVINTRDVITFQGKSVKALKRAFIDSVNDYLDFCKDRGEQPEKPFSGKLNLRLAPDLHRQAFLAAKKSGESLNGWIIKSVEEAANKQLH